MRQTKTYNINYIRLVIEIVVSLLITVGIVYATIYLWDKLNFRAIVYLTVTIAVLSIGFLSVLFLLISKIEFEDNVLTIKYLLFRQKRIDFSEIKDFSIFQSFRNVNLYYIDNRKPEKIRLLYFDKTDREKIANDIAEILKGYFEKYSEEQLDKFYEDKTQYDFTATEQHIHLFVFFVSFWAVQTFVAVVCVVLLLIFPPRGGVFSVIGEWYFWFLAISWVVILLLDKFIPKRTLACKNGVITLSRQRKILFTFRDEDVIRYWINYKEFIWVLKQSPKKENRIALMGFSRKEKRDFRNKLEILFDNS